MGMSSVFKITMSLLVALALLVTIAPSGSAEQVGAPEWQKGDQWAYGDKVYLEPAASEMIDNLTDLLESTGSVTIKNIYVNGSVEAYMFCQVADVTGDEYVLNVYLAVGVEAVADVRIAMPVPVEGSYSYWSLSEIPTENKTVSFQADVDVMAFENLTLVLDKDTMAIKSATSHTELDVEVSFSLANFYEKETNMEGAYADWTIDVTRVNYDVDIDLEMNIDAQVSFDPYLDIFDFPMTAGEAWSVTSTATASGNVTGSFDASGLPEGSMESIVEPDEGELVLPVDLSTFTGNVGDLRIEAGHLENSTGEVDLDLKCNSITEVSDDVLGHITVCEIYVGDAHDPEMIFYYSPDISMFAYMEMTTSVIDGIDLPDTGSLPIDLIPSENMRVESMEPSDAAQGIYDVSGVVVSNDVVVDDDGGDSGMDTTVIAIVIVVAIVAILGAVFLIRRKK